MAQPSSGVGESGSSAQALVSAIGGNSVEALIGSRADCTRAVLAELLAIAVQLEATTTLDSATSEYISSLQSTAGMADRQFQAIANSEVYAVLAICRVLADIRMALASPQITNFTDAVHNHQNNIGGGQLNATSVFNTGAVPVTRGGTGVSTLGDAGVLIGNGTGNVQVTGAGTPGQVFTSNGVGVDPTFQTPAAGFTTEDAQDAVGAMVDGSLTYVDATPLLQRAALTGDVTASAGSNTTAFNAAVVTAAAKTVLDDPSVSAMVDTLGGASATGTGGLVRATSPTLVTPALGTPSAVILTNATGLPTAGLIDDAVTFAKMENIATDRLIGRDTAGTGDPEALTVGGGIEFTGSGGLQTSAFTGDVTKAAGGTALTIANDAVTYAKMQNVSAASRLIGRGSAAGAGDPEELVLGTNLSMSGTTLNASGGGGTATVVEKDLGSTPVWRGSFTITDAGISASSKVLCWQSPGPYTGKGARADEAEMQPVNVLYVESGSGVCTVKWETPPMITSSPVLNDVGKRMVVGSTFDRLVNQIWPAVFIPKRLGKIRGNVKFSYMVLA